MREKRLRRGWWLGAGVLVVLVTALVVPVQPRPAHRVLAASLAPLPAGWPSGLALGMQDSPGGTAAMAQTAPFGLRYQYLAGGVNTGNGWATWNPDGAFVTYYIQESVAAGMIPVFTYYQLRQSAPNAGLSDGDADYQNLQNLQTMTAYFQDLTLLFQRAGAFPNQLVVLHDEPDLWGFLEQRATNNDAATVPAQVEATGLPDLAGLPNTAAGLAQAVLRLRDRYAPNVLVGYHLSIWGTGTDILHAKPDDATVVALAQQSAAFEQSLHAPFDLTFAEFLDRDSAFYQYQYGDPNAWYEPADYGRHVLYLGTYSAAAGQRLLLWQVPYGNTLMRAQDNTWGHYQSNEVQTLLGDPQRSELSQYVSAGVIGVLFGQGAGGTTCPCDADSDGVQNPAPINGNTGVSLSADDDGGYFRQQAAAYYAAGPLPLPGASGAAPSHFQVVGPAYAMADVPVQLTVTALDGSNNILTGYSGTVHFTSSDPAIASGHGLPSDYSFTAADQGAHSFSVLLQTTSVTPQNVQGTQTVTLADTQQMGMTGRSNGILVGSQGDVNLDGAVTAGDALCVLRQVARLAATTSCPQNTTTAAAADVNQNGAVDASDALCVLRLVASLPSTSACPIFTPASPGPGLAMHPRP